MKRISATVIVICLTMSAFAATPVSAAAQGTHISVTAAASSARFTQISSGGDFACALKANGYVECWGADASGQSDPPAVRFTQLSAGYSYAGSGFACGLKVAGSIVCWGNSPYGAVNPPTGKFVQVNAGAYLACGIRASDRSVICWRHGPRITHFHAGSFRQVAVGQRFACGLLMTGRIHCWGQEPTHFETPKPPSGVFTEVSASLSQTCAIKRSNGQVVCWSVDGGVTPPPGTFSHISMSRSPSYGFGCGIKTDGSNVCWGIFYNGPASTSLPGRITQLSAGGDFACGISSNRTVVCSKHPSLNNDTFGAAVAPAGKFTAVDSAGVASQLYGDRWPGKGFACGLRTGGRITCWGNSLYTQPDNYPRDPAGTFTQVTAGGNEETFACGLRRDRKVLCWGDPQSGETTAPSGSFSQVSAGWGFACAIRTTHRLVCWGEGIADAPTGSFIELSAGWTSACGLTMSGRIKCWGQDASGQLLAPPGKFTQVTAGEHVACALRKDGTAVCWGDINNPLWTPTPSAKFKQISAGSSPDYQEPGPVCGIEAAGKVLCWGAHTSGEDKVPSGSFIHVSVGAGYVCGLRPSGTVRCWGDWSLRLAA